MTAVDRLAAIIAEHEWRPQSTAWYEPYGACGCGHNTAQDGDWKPYDVGCWAAHLAAVIASADDLTVISLPKSNEREDGDVAVTWGEAYSNLQVGVHDEYADQVQVWVDYEPIEPWSPREAEEFASNLLAAAKAAEAVDRGEQ